MTQATPRHQSNPITPTTTKTTNKTIIPAPAPNTTALSLVGSRGKKVPTSFIGFSLETWTIPKLAGNTRHPAGPLLRLTKALGSNGAVNIRIGGDSQDRSWWLANPHRVPSKMLSDRQLPSTIANAVSAARGSEYFTTPHWVDIATNFLRATGSPAIIGLNLAENNPEHVASFAAAVYNKLPEHQLQAFEVGNEPSLYWRFPATWNKNKGQLVASNKQRIFNFSNLVNDWHRYSRALRRKIGANVPLAGNALGCPGMRWCDKSKEFYNRFHSNLRLATMHVYAMRQPVNLRDRQDLSNPFYPSISRLLKPVNSTSISQRFKDQIQLAHQSGLPIRLDEFNTTPFGGAPGVSDSFGAALWAPEAMFSMHQAGLDGVNFHFGYGTSYKPFWIKWLHGKPSAEVAPIYYGIYFFSRAIQNQARVIPLRIQNKQPGLSTWLLKDRDNNYRLAIINKNQQSRTVSIGLPTRSTAHLAVLGASSLEATSGIRWAGQSFGADGRLHGRQHYSKIQANNSIYKVQAPAQSAALLVVPSHS